MFFVHDRQKHHQNMAKQGKQQGKKRNGEVSALRPRSTKSKPNLAPAGRSNQGARARLDRQAAPKKRKTKAGKHENLQRLNKTEKKQKKQKKYRIIL